MRSTRPTYFFDNVLLDDGYDEPDELDILFGKIQQLEPPPSLISQILSSVSSLAQPASFQWDGLDGLVIHNDGRAPG